MRRLKDLLAGEATSGMVLLAAAAIALGWANSPLASSYEALWHTTVTLGIGRFVSTTSVHFWINDGLMTIFFFSVGLEIRHELHDGELADRRRAALPIAAAVGGMIAPAAIYLAFNAGQPALGRGWGVPTATDIAFAVGVLALLGKRVPPPLRLLLLALAIIDDMGAIVIIAVFYASGLSVLGLAVAVGGALVIILLQRLGVRRPLVYVVPGAIVWLGMLRAGIHPAIAGVFIGLLTPVGPSPSQTERIQAALQPWVAFGIMPLFALANAGVNLGGLELGGAAFTRISLGIVIGLVVGKPLGILLASLAAVKLRLSALPRGVSWRGLIVVGCVAGIGFTMAIFIADLAFDQGALLAAAKLAVLVASALAAMIGLLAGRLSLPARTERA